jgi:hypothetical protein
VATRPAPPHRQPSNQNTPAHTCSPRRRVSWPPVSCGALHIGGFAGVLALHVQPETVVQFTEEPALSINGAVKLEGNAQGKLVRREEAAPGQP